MTAMAIEEKKMSIDDIKEEFANFRTLVCKLKKKRDELCAIKAKLGTHSVKFSDIPKSSSPQSDKILYLIQEKIEVQNAIKNLNEKRFFERERLNKFLKSLENGEYLQNTARKSEILTIEAGILRMRYFCGFNWDEINAAFYGKNKDFNTNADLFLKKIFRYHGQAFIDLAKIANEIDGGRNGYSKND